MVDKINTPKYLFSKDGVIPTPTHSDSTTFDGSIYSAPQNTVYSTSFKSSIFESKTPTKFDFSDISRLTKIEKPRKKIIAPPAKKSINEVKPTTTEATKNTANETRNKDLEEFKKFTDELKKLIDEVKALQTKNNKVDTKEIIDKYLKIADDIPEKDKKIISSKPTKDGGKKVTTEGIAPDGSKIKTESSFNNSGELINIFRILYLDDGKIEIVEYLDERNNTKDNDPATKRARGFNIKITAENNKDYVIGYSEVVDKATGKLEVVNYDYRNKDNKYYRTRYFYDENGNKQGSHDEYGNVGGIGVRTVTDSDGKTYPEVVTSNLHLGTAQQIPRAVFDETIPLKTKPFDINTIEKSIRTIENKGKIVSEKELTDRAIIENGVTYTPKSTTYELREEQSFGKTRIDYFTITEIHSTCIGFDGEIEERWNPTLDTLQQGVKYVKTGTDELLEDNSITYSGDPVNNIILSNSQTKTKNISYINERGEIVNSQLQLTAQQNFDEQGEYTMIQTRIPDVMERTQYIDPFNPANNSDNIQFLQDGSIVNLEDINSYLAEK